jgi:hypothetical protein
MTAQYRYSGCTIIRVSDGVAIDSADPANADLAAYQTWTAEGNVPDPDPANAWGTYQKNAKFALDASDMAALRCLKAGAAFPAEWQTYVAALRAIIAAASGDASTPLPTRPAYPANT